MYAYNSTVVMDRDIMLLFDLKTSLPKFKCRSIFIYLLKKGGTECVGDNERPADHDFRNIIILFGFICDSKTFYQKAHGQTVPTTFTRARR